MREMKTADRGVNGPPCQWLAMLRPRCTLTIQGREGEDVNLPTGGGVANAKGSSTSDGEASSKPPERHAVASTPLVYSLRKGYMTWCVGNHFHCKPTASKPPRCRDTKEKNPSSVPPSIGVSKSLQEHIDSISWASARTKTSRAYRLLQAHRSLASNGLLLFSSTMALARPLRLLEKRGLDNASRMTDFGPGTVLNQVFNRLC